jgi:hypothetical protein
MAYYGSPDAVRTRTGVRAGDLGLAGEAELDTFLVQLLEEVSDVMNRLMRRDWLAELTAGTITQIPAGLHAIAADAAAAALREMVATRQTPVVRIDDFAVRTIAPQLLAPDLRRRLRLYAAGGGAASAELGLPDLAGSTWGVPDG